MFASAYSSAIPYKDLPLSSQIGAGNECECNWLPVPTAIERSTPVPGHSSAMVLLMESKPVVGK